MVRVARSVPAHAAKAGVPGGDDLAREEERVGLLLVEDLLQAVVELLAPFPVELGSIRLQDPVRLRVLERASVPAAFDGLRGVKTVVQVRGPGGPLVPNGAGSRPDFCPFSGHFHRPNRDIFSVHPELTCSVRRSRADNVTR